ncbi:alanyl-tRNA synthetase [Desulfonatronum thiosulfatophilum]|uniref:Alanine--tRNA ligase n=1 Tax=Desulfonatronum thiosulfatophilum TaxID=617002 RepID=A0A1G6E139_9BACT|nr:alanine--tRNA ligase [Desulfonatronum thiosulfatophilum]SDB51101.1 alanyl-tRNA synthetase [Desulfonatronum thiosulfatophilum]
MITAETIRRSFLDFFARNGHEIVPSSSLVPREDPTLLFTNAGMVQFKKAFLGQEKRASNRAVSSQKCLRVGGKHNDLENVGRTARHHTFFEMLGNFSFGDYFKAEAIDFAWRFLTQELGLPKERLYVTVFRDDDEAIGIWEQVAAVPRERIFRLDEKDNFWSMGDTGPCGPCSEILIDQGEAMSCGSDCGIGRCDCDRYLEIWNLVFMQYERDASGTLHPLPKPSIDTGMGLERISAVCQGVFSNFDSDLFTPLIAHIRELSGRQYGESEEIDTAMRVIADHSRSVAFLVADGIVPSNEGRGYVLRRLIRRAFRFGRLLGLSGPFLHKVCDDVTVRMGETFPELLENRTFMVRVVSQEEERFGQTLDKGLKLLSEELEALAARGERQVSGETVFKLYDTFGFPLDIVHDVAGKQGFGVDEAGFRVCMAEQKSRAKKAWKGSGENDPSVMFGHMLEAGLTTRFVGYDDYAISSRITALTDARGENVETLKTGEQGWLVAVKTPFYAASGGQAGDQGEVRTATGLALVDDVVKAGPDLAVQRVTVREGELFLDQEAELAVGEQLRLDTARHHTCTHLLQAALRTVLGDHVRQAGSFVSPDILRFDFTHTMAMTSDELRAVEDAVNQAILADVALDVVVTTPEEAQQRGALAFFGEKYGLEVRIVSVPGFSTELCGGTHLRSTGQAGSFVILSESGIAAGVRRIEALAGTRALQHWRGQAAVLREAATLLKVPPSGLPEKLQTLLAQNREITKQKEALEGQLLSGKGKDLLAQLQDVNGVPLLATAVDVRDVKAMREMMDDLRSKMSSGVIVLVAETDGKAMLIVSVSKDLHDRFTASALVKALAPLVGGSGGGRPDMAQAGGGNPAGIPQVIEQARQLVSA